MRNDGYHVKQLYEMVVSGKNVRNDKSCRCMVAAGASDKSYVVSNDVTKHTNTFRCTHTCRRNVEIHGEQKALLDDVTGQEA